MKVFFLLHIPPPFHGSSLMGSYIKHSGLIRNTFDTDFVNLSTSYKISEIGSFNFNKLVRLIRLLFLVIYKNISHKYDLFYIAIAINGKAFYRDLLLIFILKLFRKKLVLHLHNKGVSTFNNLLRRIGYKFVFKSSFIISLSDLLYTDIQEYVKKEKIYICPNGIPDIYFNDKRSSNSDRVINLMYLSNMMLSKGVFILLKACIILKNNKRNFICHFIGEWKDINEKEFYNFIIENDLGDFVKYHGPKYDTDKTEFLNITDIFIHPTLNDCFPLNLLESLQHGIPIVSTIEGGIPDIVINGENGFLCKKNDPEDLAEKIAILINDPELRLKMGCAGRKIYERKYTLEHFENRMVEILQSIVNE